MASVSNEEERSHFFSCFMALIAYLPTPKRKVKGKNPSYHSTQILNDNGILLSCSEFLHTFGIPVAPKQFVMDAIPSPSVFTIT